MSKISSKAIVTLSVALLVFAAVNAVRADAIPVIIDDNAVAPAFTWTAGGGTAARPDAYNGEDRYLGSGVDFGQWQFTNLPNGTYDVWARWSVQSNYSTAVTWSFTPDGGSTTTGTLNEKVAVFQSLANGDINGDNLSNATMAWRSLGGPSATALVTDGTLTVRFDYTAGAGVFLGLDAVRIQQVVPEPSTLVLLAAGLAGLLAYAWRKRR